VAGYVGQEVDAAGEGFQVKELTFKGFLEPNDPLRNPSKIP
jgi:hypothetical protein